MEKLGKGWKVYAGVSASTITNGVWSDDYAAEKVPDLEVAIYEWVPNANSAIVKNAVPITATTIDPIGDTGGTSDIPRQHTVRCQYMGGNNQMVPCIHAGEQVWVLQFEGGDMWYWLPMARITDMGIRRHEHIRWFAMNRDVSVTGKDKIKDISDNDTYFVDINTNKGYKLLQVHTARNDGEYCGYDIRIHPEKGYLEITDTIGNILSLDSVKTIWRVRNINDSFVELNKGDITISCPGNMTLKCGGDMLVDVGGKRTQKVGSTEDVTIGSNRTTLVGASDTLKISSSRTTNVGANDTLSISGTHALTCATYSMSSGVATLDGAITVSGATFTVASAHGLVPVIIVYGSSAW